jgi:hypothetical protein
MFPHAREGGGIKDLDGSRGDLFLMCFQNCYHLHYL